MDAKQFRICKSIACDKLKGRECSVQECVHLDIAVALAERIKQLRAARR